MSVNLESVRAQVRVLVGEANLTTLTDDAMSDIIAKALARYSRVRPVRLVSAMTGNTTGIYALPSSFEPGFSQILEVEYPTGKAPKETIEDEFFEKDRTPTGHVLRFSGCNPGNGETFWLKYTGVHSASSDGVVDEMPEADQAGFEYLCSSLICTKLASFYASKANPSLPGTEIVAFNERVAEYSSMANKWMDRFNAEIKDECTGLIGSMDFIKGEYFERDDE